MSRLCWRRTHGDRVREVGARGACGRNADAQDVGAYEIGARTMAAHKAHARQVTARDLSVRTANAREAYARKAHAHEVGVRRAHVDRECEACDRRTSAPEISAREAASRAPRWSPTDNADRHQPGQQSIRADTRDDLDHTTRASRRHHPGPQPADPSPREGRSVPRPRRR
ncbi:hypothetical protein Asi02nite_26670 [Asanoa siamensis]|uniref:Uncharacterized protein n=1 Tax=Asanoa siamensis TaxID=926357 RepID=A0ABQ4CPD7_9ACTN|nr:hypothetical protein Asi02nite_26670 [Asanoa siamensis]